MKHEQDERNRKNKHKHQCHETAKRMKPFLKLRDARFEMGIGGFTVTSFGLVHYTHKKRVGEVEHVFKLWALSMPIFE